MFSMLLCLSVLCNFRGLFALRIELKENYLLFFATASVSPLWQGLILFVGAHFGFLFGVSFLLFSPPWYSFSSLFFSSLESLVIP